MVKALQIVIPAAAAVSTLVLTGSQLNRVEVDLDVMRELVRGDDRRPLPLDEAAELDSARLTTRSTTRACRSFHRRTRSAGETISEPAARLPRARSG